MGRKDDRRAAQQRYETARRRLRSSANRKGYMDASDVPLMDEQRKAQKALTTWDQISVEHKLARKRR